VGQKNSRAKTLQKFHDLRVALILGNLSAFGISDTVINADPVKLVDEVIPRHFLALAWQPAISFAPQIEISGFPAHVRTLWIAPETEKSAHPGIGLIEKHALQPN
jgi:hypothetical protein